MEELDSRSPLIRWKQLAHALLKISELDHAEIWSEVAGEAVQPGIKPLALIGFGPLQHGQMNLHCMSNKVMSDRITCG